MTITQEQTEALFPKQKVTPLTLDWSSTLQRGKESHYVSLKKSPLEQKIVFDCASLCSSSAGVCILKF